MSTVRDIVKNKIVRTIGPDTTVQGAIRIMSSENIPALPVVENGNLIGIVTERDYIRNITSQKIPAWSVKIDEIMTRKMVAVKFETSIEHCQELMNENKIRHLPVLEGGEVVGLISITDVLSALYAVPA